MLGRTDNLHRTALRRTPPRHRMGPHRLGTGTIHPGVHLDRSRRCHSRHRKDHPGPGLSGQRRTPRTSCLHTVTARPCLPLTRG